MPLEEIDIYDLVKENLKQVNFCSKILKMNVSALDQKAREKAKLEIIKARLYKDIKANPEKYELDKKPTENAVSTEISLNKEYIEQNEKVLEAEKQCNLIVAEKSTLAERRSSLDNIVKLFLNSYYNENVHEGKKLSEVNDNKQKETRKKMNEMLKKCKK